MSKNTEKRKKLRYDRHKDPNTNCYRDDDGSYVFTRDVKHGNCKKKEEVFRFFPKDYPNGAEIVLAMSDSDYSEDVQEEEIHEHTDKVFQEQISNYEKAENDSQLTDPWEEIAYYHGGDDVFAQIFPEDMPHDEKLEKLKEFIDTLQPQQADLFYQHLGACRTLEEIRLEEQERTGKAISQQAVSDRWNKILTRACKFFNVPKPRKRRKKDE